MAYGSAAADLLKQRKSSSPIRPAGSPTAVNGGTPPVPTPVPQPGPTGPTPPGTQPPTGGAEGDQGAQAPQAPPPPPTQPAPPPPPSIAAVPPPKQPAGPSGAMPGGVSPVLAARLPKPVPAGSGIPREKISAAKAAQQPDSPGAKDARLHAHGAKAAPLTQVKPSVPMGPNGSATAPLPAPAPIPPSPDPDLAPFGDVINPANDLRNKTILPGADPRLEAYAGRSDQALADIAKVDRYALAKDKFDRYAKDTEGAYQFANRAATLGAAAKGRTGSGMLRTDYGNLDLARGRDLDSARDRFLADALEGSIDDSFRKADTLTGAERDLVGRGRDDRAEVRGERDYENEMERQAFNRRRQQVFDEDALIESQFGRDYRRLSAGEAGNPGYSEIDVAQGRRKDANADAEDVAGLLEEVGAQQGLQGQGQGIQPGMSQEEIDAILAGAGTPNGAAPTSDDGPPVIVGSVDSESPEAYAAKGLVWAPGTRSHGMRRP